MKKVATVLSFSLFAAAVAVPSSADVAAFPLSLEAAPTWTRPLPDCTGLSGLGLVRYVSQAFYVETSGAYDFESVQTGGWNGVIFIYEKPFDPNSPNANCIAGNDDGAGGVGTSKITAAPLSAGVQYYALLTEYDPGQLGATTTNTLSGPGTIQFGQLLGTADLFLTLHGARVADSFVYSLSVANAGPDPVTSARVTDHLPSGLSYVSDTCDGQIIPPLAGTGEEWRWSAGSLAVGASASCTLTASIGDPACQVYSNTATASADRYYDPSLGNNSVTANLSSCAGANETTFDVAVPTLSEMGLLAMACLLAISAFFVLRKG